MELLLFHRLIIYRHVSKIKWKQYYCKIVVFYTLQLIYSCEFLAAITPVHSSVAHDPLEIILKCWFGV